jgi:two-component system, cell cycle sensor histidine kinase and response regulator CckA
VHHSAGDVGRSGTLPFSDGDGTRDFFASKLYEAISEAFVALDRDWRFVHVNSRAAAIAGRDAASLLGRNVWEEFPDAVGRPFYDACQRAVATENPLVADGCFAPWDCRCTSRLYPSAHGLLIVFGDGEATDVRKTHGVEQSRYLRAILDTAPECIKVLRRDGSLLDMNEAGLALIEAPSLDAVAGHCVYPLVVERDRKAFQQAVESACDGESPRLEFEIVTLGGQHRLMESRIVPLRDQGGIIIAALCMTSDITDRRALEIHLRQAQKLEAVGQLAGGVAHDFNNLLTVIGNYGQFLGEELPPGSRARADLEELLGATRRAAALTRQLLTFGRKQVPVPKLLDPNEVIRGVQTMLRRLIGEHIALVADLEPNVGRVLVDPGQLEQVLVNLVLNARDAMPEGGLLTVETGNVRLTAGGLLQGSTDGGVTALVGTPGDHVVISITDNGAGMDDATLRRAFEPYFTTKPQGRGTGLGLATIYGIVAQAGGALRVRSAVDAGTTVEVYLPYHEAPNAARSGDDAGATVPTSAHGRETVLVAEDEAAVRESVRRILERAGYTVIEARHGADALLLWRERKDEIALVLTDLVMPEMRGSELAASIRETSPDARVIYMSGYASAPARASVQAGDVLIEKPFEADTLLRVVRENLDDGVRTGVH